ncbi:MAG: IclR family transcriptional regulator [Burkholderiaceae bacterium]|nr:IclR family transcriptional regulator [Burkholderiaceae bacterium]
MKSGKLSTGVSEYDVGPRSPLRTVEVLRELARHEGAGVSLAALAAKLQCPKTSLFRLLRSLEAGKYVISASGEHQLGPAALELGFAITNTREFPRCASTTLQALAQKCRETVILGVLASTKKEILYAAVIDGTHPLRFSATVGSKHPLYGSACGLAVLAHSAPADQSAYIKSVKFKRLATKTIMSTMELKRRLEEIRTDGIVISADGMVEGVHSFAAPIRQADGTVHAALSISAPNAHAVKNFRKFEQLARDAAAEISAILGYTK